jgi:CRP-like cAMP-binding protein
MAMLVTHDPQRTLSPRDAVHPGFDQQSVASHTVEARMCRWLLRIRDLNQSNEMKLTQEFLGQMLGVRRTSVSLVASTLQQAGWIKYRRGSIQITDVEGLRSGVCECYEKVFSHYKRLLLTRDT